MTKKPETFFHQIPNGRAVELRQPLSPALRRHLGDELGHLRPNLDGIIDIPVARDKS